MVTTRSKQAVSEADDCDERRDRLSYIADLINELELLAAREQGCDTLVGLLALARAEAERQTVRAS